MIKMDVKGIQWEAKVQCEWDLGATTMVISSVGNVGETHTKRYGRAIVSVRKMDHFHSGVFSHLCKRLQESTMFGE